MKLEIARTLAESLVFQMHRYCERIEICGSIRRGKPNVKDIEIVAVPRWKTVPKNDTLFLEEHRINQLWFWAQSMKDRGLIQWIKTGTHEIVEWPIKPDGKQWRGVLRTGINKYEWRGFSEGGTLRSLVEQLRDYIRTGKQVHPQSFGPWPQWYCDGDLWGYGDDMQQVRDKAISLEISEMYVLKEQCVNTSAQNGG
jgi:hypothetical protein